jgi:hypothetical protein
MRLKPDLDQTCRRFEAWWRRDMWDRPPATVRVAPARPYDGPVRRHASLRERWFDVSFAVESALARLRQHDYLGDALPFWMPNVGPELTGTLLGCELEFGEDTSWSEPIVHDVDQWRALAAREPDFANPYWRAIEAMTLQAIDAFAGEAMVGLADLHGNYDILAALRDPQMLCLDLVDDPEAVRGAADAAVRAFCAGLVRLHELIAPTGQPMTTWTPFAYRGLAYVPSCDFWCLVGPDMARDVILPAIVAEMRPMQRSVFHLDGPQALPHLDLLLQLPQLDAVQWVYGAGNGPAARWIDVYRRIRAAGKSVHLLAESAADAMTVLDAIGPAGVWIDVVEPFDTAAEATRFLDQLRRSVTCEASP